MAIVSPKPKSAPDVPPAIRMLHAVSPPQNGRQAPSRFVIVEREKLDLNPFQPRKKFDPDDLKQLGESMFADGQLLPLTVRAHPIDKGRYQIIAGERRLRASQPRADFNGLPRLECVVRDATDQQMADLAFIENDQRADLTPAEQIAYVDRLTARGLSVAQIGGLLKRDRGWVQNRTRAVRVGDDLQWLFDYPETLSIALKADKVKDLITRRAVITFLRDKYRHAGASVSQLEDFIAERSPAPRPPKIQKQSRFGNAFHSDESTPELAHVDRDTGEVKAAPDSNTRTMVLDAPDGHSASQAATAPMLPGQRRQDPLRLLQWHGDDYRAFIHEAEAGNYAPELRAKLKAEINNLQNALAALDEAL